MTFVRKERGFDGDDDEVMISQLMMGKGYFEMPIQSGFVSTRFFSKLDYHLDYVYIYPSPPPTLCLARRTLAKGQRVMP